MTMERQDDKALSAQDRNVQQKRLLKGLARTVGILFAAIVGIATVVQMLIDAIVNREALIAFFQGPGAAIKDNAAHLVGVILAGIGAGLSAIGRTVVLSVLVLILGQIVWEMLSYLSAHMKGRRYPAAYVDARLRQRLMALAGKGVEGSSARRELLWVIGSAVVVSAIGIKIIPVEFRRALTDYAPFAPFVYLILALVRYVRLYPGTAEVNLMLGLFSLGLWSEGSEKIADVTYSEEEAKRLVGWIRLYQSFRQQDKYTRGHGEFALGYDIERDKFAFSGYLRDLGTQHTIERALVAYWETTRWCIRRCIVSIDPECVALGVEEPWRDLARSVPPLASTE
jgi:hypothetical protein